MKSLTKQPLSEYASRYDIPQDPVLAEIAEPIHELSEERGEWEQANAAYGKLNEALGKVMLAMHSIGDPLQRPWVAVHLAFAMGHILDVAQHYNINLEGAVMTTHRSRVSETYAQRNFNPRRKGLTSCVTVIPPVD